MCRKLFNGEPYLAFLTFKNMKSDSDESAGIFQYRSQLGTCYGNSYT